ncbi:hypothetical protein HDU97_007948, partial [Phlyctochytrium planicorne]
MAESMRRPPQAPVLTIPNEVIWEISIYLPPRTIVKCQRAFGMGWISIDLRFALLNLRTIHGLPKNNSRIPCDRSFLNSLTAADWHRLGAAYLAAYMALAGRFNVPRLAPVESVFQSDFGDVQIHSLTDDNRQLLNDAFGIVLGYDNGHWSVFHTCFSATREMLRGFQFELRPVKKDRSCVRFLACLGMAHIDVIEQCLMEEEHAVRAEFQEALTAGTFSAANRNYFESWVVHRIARSWNETMMCACRHGEMEVLRRLKSGLPSEVVGLVNKEGILLMATRRGDLGFIKSVMELFDINVERCFVVKVAKNFEQYGKELTEWLCGHMGLPDGELLKIAVEIGSVDCFEAFWDGVTLADPWERWLTLTLNAINRMKAPTPNSNLGDIPACRLFKNLLAERDNEEFDVLQEAYSSIISFLTGKKMSRAALFAFLSFLSVNMSAISQFAVVAVALKNLGGLPSNLRSVFDECWQKPELDATIAKFFDGEINDPSTSKQRLWKLLSPTVLFRTRTDHYLVKILNITRLIESRDVVILAWRDPWRAPWRFANLTSAFSSSSDVFDEAKRAIGRNDMAALLRCCLDCRFDGFELAKWVLGRDDREMLSVDVVLVVLGSIGYRYNWEIWRDLFELLFEVVADDGDGRGDGSGDREMRVSLLTNTRAQWASREDARNRIKRLSLETRKRAATFFMNVPKLALWTGLFRAAGATQVHFISRDAFKLATLRDDLNERLAETVFSSTRDVTFRTASGKICRMFYPQEPIRVTGEDNGDTSVKRVIGTEYINPFNPTILATLKCNNDVRFVSGDRTKRVAAYITQYVFKTQDTTFNANAFAISALHESVVNADQAQHQHGNDDYKRGCRILSSLFTRIT